MASRGMFPQIQLDASGSQPEEENSNELENALIRLEEEQQRWAGSLGGCEDSWGILPEVIPNPRSS